MATLKAGGRISSFVKLTLQADGVALLEGDPVHITTTYKCVKADGSKPVVGWVNVANTKRLATGGDLGADTGGDVSVESPGTAVVTTKSGGAVAAGIRVGVNAAGKIAAVGAGVATVGISLSSTTAVDQDIDVLLIGA